MTSFKTLFLAAKFGRTEEFQELTEALRPRLVKFISRRMGTHLPKYTDADDILQETFTRSIDAIERAEWRGEGALFNWFCGIACNVILESERRFLRIKDFPEREPVADITSPSRHLKRKERFSRLKQSLDRLTADQREVIQLFRIEGLSLAEVSRRMGRKEKATYQLLWRAMEKLKDDMQDTASLHLPDERLDPIEQHDEPTQ